MTAVRRFWPLLTATHRYEKTISTRGRGAGVTVEAPILAYLIETTDGRVLYDVGCDYGKIADPSLCSHYYDAETFAFGPPSFTEEDRLSARLEQLGLRPTDVDAVVIGHLHFDHAGGLRDMAHADIHIHPEELADARRGEDPAYFADDFEGPYNWRLDASEYEIAPGIRLMDTPGHTAGHRSLYVELPDSRPVIIAGDAADLQENLDDEVPPGLCWQDRTDLAVDSIRRLKSLALVTGALIWPNHDMAFFRRHDRFPLAFSVDAP